MAINVVIRFSLITKIKLGHNWGLVGRTAFHVLAAHNLYKKK